MIILFIILIVLTAVICIIIHESKNRQNNNPNNIQYPQQYEQLPYKKKYLLTKNEWYFYKALKVVANKYGYHILTKIRIADLVEVNVSEKKEYLKWFNKINKKHVDFALANPDNLEIILLIELDDNSHNQKQKNRDDFVNKIYSQTGYKILRVRGTNELEAQILDAINPVQTVQI